tara:strand:- start:650 stop:2002 length:1353 start_codon:yes stop_codon:yes gene_type:complete
MLDLNARNVLRSEMAGSVALHKIAADVLAAQVVATVDMPQPLYVSHAKGSRVWDVDGREYIDLTMGFGTHVLGHAPASVVEAVSAQAARGLQYGLHNPYQVQLAQLLLEAAPAMDEVVFTNSGTEATMYAVRAARAFTGKTGIALFDGSYHGVHDAVLAGALRDSPREAPLAYAKGDGIPASTMADVLMLPYRSAAAFDLIRSRRETLAAVLVEPVQSSNPRVDVADWLKELRNVCAECGVLFILDEVITGFRLAFGGAQERFGITADMATYGKALGGGAPIGAVAGKGDIMGVFGRGAPAQSHGAGKVRIFAGTSFAGNPLAMCAGIAAVTEMRDRKSEIYPRLEARSQRLAEDVNAFLTAKQMPVQLRRGGSMFHMPFQRGEIGSARDVRGENPELENEFYMRLLANGVIVPGIHVAFLSDAHSDADINLVLVAYIRSFQQMRDADLL